MLKQRYPAPTRYHIVTSNNQKGLFEFWQVVATLAALEALQAAEQTPIEFIQHHRLLDQGDLCDDDHQANAEAVAMGGRVFSAFVVEDAAMKIWVIRSVTTILTPDDY